MPNPKYIPPSCPEGYKLNPTNCWCEKYKTVTKKKVNNKKTNKKRVKTKLNELYQKLIEKNSSKYKSLRVELHKRCPKGYKRNKKTGHCDPINNKTNNKKVKTKQKNNKKTIKKVSFKTPTASKKLTVYKSDQTNNKSNNNNNTKNLIQQYQNIVRTVNKSKKKSYSPQINKQLNEIKQIIKQPINDCKTLETRKDPQLYLNYNGKMQCLKYDHPLVVEKLLNNLYSNQEINYNKIIAPNQIKSNCWFNSFFMNFFVSDKGLKFFRYLRNIMITGVKFDKTKLDKKVHKALFLLNLSIDATLMSNKDLLDDNTNFLLRLDTNHLIKKIHAAIPKDYKEIVGVNKAGNPVEYYLDIIKYLNHQPIVIEYINYSLFVNQDKIG